MKIERAIVILKGREKFVADINIDAKIAYKMAIESLENQMPYKVEEVKKMFVVTWIDQECMNTRVYSKRDYAEKLVRWCNKHNLDYCFAEETVDREILD